MPFCNHEILEMEKTMKMFTLAAFCLTTIIAGAATATETNNNTTKPQPVSKTVAKTTVAPHCEVPCGIYADQMRFEQMLEDTKTIAKAIAQINEMAETMASEPPTPKSINQVSRWVSTKENHATNTQHIVAQYFLTQRIKPDHKEYTGQLATAHRVMVAAMKCKQDADPATAEALKKAILELYEAYEGKKPNFEHSK